MLMRMAFSLFQCDQYCARYIQLQIVSRIMNLPVGRLFTVFFPNDIGKIGNFCQFLFKTKMPTLPLILVSFSLLRQRFHAFLSHFQVFFDAIFPIKTKDFPNPIRTNCLNREKNGNNETTNKIR